MDNVYRTIGTHHSDLGLWVGQVHVRTDVLTVHYVVGAPIGLPSNQRDLRYRGLGEGVEQLGPVLDDAAPLLLRTRQKAGDVNDVKWEC